MQETAFQRYCSVSYPDTRMILQLIMRMLFHVLWLSSQTCFKKLHRSYRIFFVCFVMCLNYYTCLVTALFSRITCRL